MVLSLLSDPHLARWNTTIRDVQVRKESLSACPGPRNPVCQRIDTLYANRLWKYSGLRKKPFCAIRMKLLLDGSLPRRLKNELSPHEVMTVPERGWAGK